jgi:ketosteroid isomerase-like protein
MTVRTPEDLLPRITAAINAGDPIEVVKYFDEQGCFVLPDGAVVRGHAELLAMYEQRLALRPRIRTHAAKIIQAADVAVVTNVWSTRLRNGEIDGKDLFEGVATLVLRRDAHDSWRILVDDSNR